MLRPLPTELMRAYPVAPRVSSVRNNDPALLDPLVLAAWPMFGVEDTGSALDTIAPHHSGDADVC